MSTHNGLLVCEVCRKPKHQLTTRLVCDACVRGHDRLWARNGTRWVRALWRVVRELEKELAKARDKKGGGA